MQQRKREPSPAALPRAARAEPSTPSLLNEAYTRLRTVARAYEHACSADGLHALHRWMHSYGRRLSVMADALQDEGARAVRRYDRAASDVFDECMCDNPHALLAEAQAVQEQLLACFELMTYRLDMDAELYDLLTEGHEELGESLRDIGELRREYEAYLAAEN